MKIQIVESLVNESMSLSPVTIGDYTITYTKSDNGEYYLQLFIDKELKMQSTETMSEVAVSRTLNWFRAKANGGLEGIAMDMENNSGYKMSSI